MLTNTHQGFSVAFVTGSPGSGKSFVCTRDVIYRLINSDVTVRTNLPLEVDAIAEYVAKKRQCSEDEVRERIELLDPQRLHSWRDWEGGPWDLAAEGKAQNSELILDECHLFCPATGIGAIKFGAIWTGWLGEVRHEGWRRIVFVTQDETKVGKPIITHSELRFELTNAERLRDPFLRVPLSDWYELIASLSGRYVSSVTVDEYRRIKGKLRSVHRERVRLEPEWFKFYRSHQAAGGGSREGAIDRPKREFEKRPRFWRGMVDGRRMWPTWGWFLRRHFFRIAGLALLVAGFLWLTAFGGIRYSIKRFFSFGAMMGRAEVAASAPQEPGAPPARPVKSLKDVYASMSAEDRSVIETAFKAASEELNARQVIIDGLAAGDAESVVDVVPLPRVTAFVGERHVVVEGRKLGVGDHIFLDGGKRRLRVVSIDRRSRMVRLEDARLLPFTVNRDVPLSGGMSVPGSRSSGGGAVPTPAAMGIGVQPVGRPASSGEPAAGREKSILERRTDAAE